MITRSSCNAMQMNCNSKGKIQPSRIEESHGCGLYQWASSIRGRNAFCFHVNLTSFALCVLLSHPLFAQPRFEFRPERISFSQSATLVSWRMEQAGITRNIRQFYLPARIQFLLGKETALDVGTAGGFTNADLPQSADLAGLTDFHLRLSHRFPNDRWYVGAGVNLPSGKNQLDSGERLLVDMLAEGVLGFPLQRYGVGTNAEASVAHALNLTDGLGLGLGTSVVISGPFEFLRDSSASYKPGPRYTATVLLNDTQAPLKWRVSMLAEYFGNDQLDGRDYFRQGWQLEPSAAIEWHWKKDWQSNLTLRHVYKADNDFLAQQVTSVVRHYYIDNSTYARLAMSRNFGPRMQTGAIITFSHFGESNQQLDNAKIWRFGVQSSAKLSENWMVGTNGDYATGSAEEGLISLRGYGINVWVRGQF